MPTDTADLGSLIAQRLCHDLVNPLGAVGNGLELLAMQQSETPEMALMRDSLAQALGRIKLYRLAFGSSEGTATGADLAEALQALGTSRPIALATELPASLPRRDARLLALLALCAETALAWGGSLRVQAEEPAPPGDSAAPMPALRVTAAAPRLRLDAELWQALAQGQAPAALTPPQVQFALLARAAAGAGRRLRIDQAEGQVTLAA